MYKKLLETKAKVIGFQSALLEVMTKKADAYEMRQTLRAMKQEIREMEKILSDEEIKNNVED